MKKPSKSVFVSSFQIPIKKTKHPTKSTETRNRTELGLMNAVTKLKVKREAVRITASMVAFRATSAPLLKYSKLSSAKLWFNKGFFDLESAFLGSKDYFSSATGSFPLMSRVLVTD